MEAAHNDPNAPGLLLFPGTHLSSWFDIGLPYSSWSAALVNLANSLMLVDALDMAEGTTTNGDYLLPFKTGAFRARTPVQPVILKYPFRRFSPAWDTISGVSLCISVSSFR